MTPRTRITDRWLADALAIEHHWDWAALRAQSDPVKCYRCNMVHPDRQQYEEHLADCEIVLG